MDQSSPFLRLPLELRRRIFEFLPVRTKLVTTFKDRTKYPVGKKIPVLVLVLRYVERNIIQTCRQLAEEAEPILEIETMKLGPPSFIIRASVLSLIKSLLSFVCATQDEIRFRRLRMTDKDRGEMTLNGQGFVMWIRIANLNLLSEPQFYIGLYFDLHLPGTKVCVAEYMGMIRQLVWWNDGALHRKPHYRVFVEYTALRDFYEMHYLSGATGVHEHWIEKEFILRNFGVASFKDVL